MKKILSTGDVARETGWHIAKVRGLIDAGKLPAIDTSTGRRPLWSIHREDLDAFLMPGNRAAVPDGQEPANA